MEGGGEHLMEAEAFGFLAAIVGTVAMSQLAGVITGTVVWRCRRGLAFGCFCISVYLLVAPPLVGFRYWPFVRINGSPSLMTFLLVFVTARYLRAQHHLNTVWSTLTALGLTLTLAFLYMRLFTKLLLSTSWAPGLIALGVDLCLAGLAIRYRNID